MNFAISEDSGRCWKLWRKHRKLTTASLFRFFAHLLVLSSDMLNVLLYSACILCSALSEHELRSIRPPWQASAPWRDYISCCCRNASTVLRRHLYNSFSSFIPRSVEYNRVRIHESFNSWKPHFAGWLWSYHTSITTVLRHLLLQTLIASKHFSWLILAGARLSFFLLFFCSSACFMAALSITIKKSEKKQKTKIPHLAWQDDWSSGVYKFLW